VILQTIRKIAIAASHKYVFSQKHFMEQQSYTNHRRYVPGFHYLLSTLILFVLVLAVISLIHVIGKGDASFREILYTGILPLVIAVILILLFWYSRAFAAKVQDRAIRAEENFRFFILTGKPMDNRLTMSQVVALRFAPDDELKELTQEAIDKNLTPDQIKKTIKKWKADHHRA
jgi:Family of unknown function (DUF6526)